MNFEEYVNTLKRKINTYDKELLFVCIGNSKILWDSIGPQVGSFLERRIDTKYVLGDMKRNVCSKWDLMLMNPKMKNKFVVAIDTAMTETSLVGEIFVNSKPIMMGLGVNQNKGIVGDVSIKVGISDLKCIDRRFVREMVEFVGEGICEAKIHR